MEEMHRVLADETSNHFERMTSHFDQNDKTFGEFKEKNSNNQHLTGPQHETQKPRLAVKADVNLDMKTQERMEGTAADDEKYGDISSARVDDDLMRLISFGGQNLTEPSVAFTVSNDGALVVEGVEAPKPRLLPVKMRMLTPTSGLLHTGSASIPRRNIFHSQSLPWGFREMTKKRQRYDKSPNKLQPACPTFLSPDGYRNEIEAKSRA